MKESETPAEIFKRSTAATVRGSVSVVVHACSTSGFQMAVMACASVVRTGRTRGTAP